MALVREWERDGKKKIRILFHFFALVLFVARQNRKFRSSVFFSPVTKLKRLLRRLESSSCLFHPYTSNKRIVLNIQTDNWQINNTQPNRQPFLSVILWAVTTRCAYSLNWTNHQVVLILTTQSGFFQTYFITFSFWRTQLLVYWLGGFTSAPSPRLACSDNSSPRYIWCPAPCCHRCRCICLSHHQYSTCQATYPCHRDILRSPCLNRSTK